MLKRLPQLQIAIGIWILISPWILGFHEFTPALWSSVLAGAGTALIGLWEMFGKEEKPTNTNLGI